MLFKKGASPAEEVPVTAARSPAVEAALQGHLAVETEQPVESESPASDPPRAAWLQGSIEAESAVVQSPSHAEPVKQSAVGSWQSPVGDGAEDAVPQMAADFGDADAWSAEPEDDEPEKMHRVVDGDTLTKLAARYLGDPERYLELFEYNRDVLRSPDLLPIGSNLRIPPKLGGVLRPSAASAERLVPVLPAAVRSHATRLPQTYTVQPSETLTDIARKVYGDGRRHEQIFAANRDRLRHPQDLRPGMTLIIP